MRGRAAGRAGDPRAGKADVARAPRTVATELARLLRGELEVRDFPWLDPEERKALGALGMSMLGSGRADAAAAAFRVLTDLEPDQGVHHLMVGHACALGDEVQAAFEAFSRAIALCASRPEGESVASEAFLARGDLLLRLGRVVEARADLADAASRMRDAGRRRSLEAFLAS